jgi:IS30 family transposase
MAGERVAGILKEYRKHYQKASREARSRMLDEFCAMTGYHRKYAVALLNRPPDEVPVPPRRRGKSYSEKSMRIIEKIWEAAGYPWSARLVALLPQWLPWAAAHFEEIDGHTRHEILSISARQIDRRLQKRKRAIKGRIYGRTKPGTLLKHHIPIKTEHWDVQEPGHLEIDLVSHSGPNASGEFIHSMNATDIHTGWCETRAIMGKGEAGVVVAMEDIRRTLPFAIKSIDSDNGSEFINYHLVGYCQKHKIHFTRSRPYKKNDNAHIEQKNWTHVRRIFGWVRLDTPEQLQAMNALYKGELRLMMNLFQPCVKLISKERVGSKLRRKYDKPATPLKRLAASFEKTPPLTVTKHLAQSENFDPFLLSWKIDRQVAALTQPKKKLSKALP